jgi:hypothetical protein
LGSAIAAAVAAAVASASPDSRHTDHVRRPIRATGYARTAGFDGGSRSSSRSNAQAPPSLPASEAVPSSRDGSPFFGTQTAGDPAADVAAAEGVAGASSAGAGVKGVSEPSHALR